MGDLHAAIKALADELEAEQGRHELAGMVWRSPIAQRLRAALAADTGTDREALARVKALLSTPAPPKWDGDCYEGRVGGTEHRTAGGRAWCFQCGEWCYPESYACPCCEPRVHPDDLRAAIAGTNGGGRA